MGVPKFFRWVAERCPSVITPFRDCPPPVDNLYLDMNGIIHNCTHPNDVDATQKSATEKAMVEAMFVYLEKLFNAIQPRKHFLLAIDGVAPRAKMNQQRQRRYRSAYDMMVAREEAFARGEELPDEKDVFDSNCITPGTNFMVRVSEQLQYFITMKIATDPAWQNCKVIYSGHNHPGEGEHKIVDFIRRRKMQPGYDPNESHCMYGLDADLVMLALATHEPHFLLLRELVTFGAGNESRRVREQREEDEANGIVADKSYRKSDEFVLFHVNVLRDYLDLDLRDRLGAKLPASYDLERVLDDFVLMCFFVGNDFLPSIPTLGIHDGSLVYMLDVYCQRILQPSMYLTENGKIDWRAVELWLQGLAEIEFTTIKAREAQEQEYQRKMARRDPSHEATAIASNAVESLQEYKDRFYREKHGFANGWDPQGKEMSDLRLHYVEGIMWVFGYYYNGPPSWKWFFPHHYAPMASDLVNLPAVAAKVHFELGKPFLPHQQLLAVLPPLSYRSIPRAYWPLLRSKTSPLAKYFPEHLQIDREGARAPWEGVVLIPFIDERTLLAAYNSVQDKVTPEDQACNTLGSPVIFTFDAEMQQYELPNEYFGPLKNVRVRRQAFEFPPFVHFVPRLCPGVAIGDKMLEGFATLHSKWNSIHVRRETGVVSVFGMATRKESVILALNNDSMDQASARDVAPLVGQEVLVGFPHYRRARIACISDRYVSIRAVLTKDGTFCGSEAKELNRDDSSNFVRECDTHKQYMKEKLGIAVDNVSLLVYVNLFTGMRVERKGRIVRNFSKDEMCYAMPLISRLQDVDMIPDARYVERNRAEGDTSFGAKVIFIGPEPKNKKTPMQAYGSAGFVLDSTSYGEDIYAVAIRVYQDPLTIPASLLSYATPRNWMTLHEVASELRLGSLPLRLLVGSLRTTPQYGSREVGLGLVFTRNHLTRLGYAKLVPRQTNAWTPYSDDVFSRLAQSTEPAGHYLENASKSDFLGRSSRAVQYTTWFSREAVSLIKQYVHNFQPLIKRLETGAAAPQALEPPQFMTGIWQDKEVDDVLSEMEAFIEACGVRDVPLVNASDDAFTRDHLRELEAELDRHTPRRVRELTLRPVIKRHLYFPITRSVGGHILQLPLPQDQTISLGARVVNCRAAGCVPFGAVGTVVRLLATSHEAEVVFDETFTGGSRFDGRLQQPRGALVKLASLLVLHKPGDDNNGASILPTSITNTTNASTIGVAGTGETETSATSLLKAFLLKTQQQQQQQQQQEPQQINIHQGPSLTTDSGPAIPKPRSALEETAPTMVASPSAAVTMSAGAGGIRLADLVGKLKTSSPASLSAEHILRVQPNSAPTTVAWGSNARASPPAAVKTPAGGVMPAVSNNNNNNNNNNTSGSGNENKNDAHKTHKRNEDATTAATATTNNTSNTTVQRSNTNSGVNATVTGNIINSSGTGSRPLTQPHNNVGGCIGVNPNSTGTISSGGSGSAKRDIPIHIPREIETGEFTLRRGEAVPFFRKLFKLRLAEELNKMVPRE
ncbi:putative 5-3 exonuclease [Trypanosoma melophagium]|uniref:putative 5-3 exonuclease n=1 Tax=Trypanosoma melophagium TaxID=715481 RepID=UPI00351A034F|nr:putative 5-3 exonuclease [Trypanosoma melophagium]